MNAATTISRMSFKPRKYSRTVLITRRPPGGFRFWTQRAASRPQGSQGPTSAPEDPLEERQSEVHHEGGRGDPHRRADLAGLAPDRLDEAVGDEAGADAVGDRVRERHQ